MRAFSIALCIVFLSSVASPQQPDFDAFSKKFVSGYNALNMPQLDLSYITNLQHIGSAAQIKKQYIFFTEIKSRLSSYDPKLLKRFTKNRL